LWIVGKNWLAGYCKNCGASLPTYQHD
jgi:hypothetical protein